MRLVAAQSGDGSLSSEELAMLEPTTYVIVICQLYAAQKGLPKLPLRGNVAGGPKLAKWFERISKHANEAPKHDPWADFVVDAINQSPKIVESE